jgi:hypothetical protein
MADDTQPYEAPAAKDYFSDNTQSRGERQYVRETGASLGAVRSRRRPQDAKRQGSVGDCMLQVMKRISQRELDAQLDKLNIPRPSDEPDMLPILRDGMFPYIGELLRQFG